MFKYVLGATIDIGTCSTLAVVSLAAVSWNLYRSAVFVSNVLLLVAFSSVLADKHRADASSDSCSNACCRL